MTDLFGLAWREVLFLVFLGCLGAGPAAYLPRGFSPWLRVAFAPVLGMTIGASAFTTIEWFIDGERARWFIPVALLLSMAEGIRRSRAKKAKLATDDASPRRRSGAQLKSALQVLLVVIAVSLPPAFLLASQHSIGPVVYEVYDSPGYVADVDAIQVMSIGQADHLKTPAPTFEIAHWVQQVITNNRLDIAPLVAAFNALLGLHETDVWAAFLIGALVAGTLALYACICFAVGSSTWFACIGAVLFGGAFFLQLFADGSQAAVAGLALIVPALLFARITKHDPSWSNMFIAALLLAGLSTLYPILVLLIVAACVIYLLVAAGRRSNRHWRVAGRELVRDAFGFVIIFALAALLDVVAFSRNLSAWLSLLKGNGASPGQPQYHLGYGVIASWLLQTRDFYSVAFGPQSPLSDFLPGLLIPLVVLVAAALGVRIARYTWIPIAFVVLSGLVATKQIAAQSCSYCENRSLVPAVPPLLFIIFTAAAAYCINADIKRRAMMAAFLAPFLAFVGLSVNNERIRFAATGIFLGDSTRHAIASIPPTKEPVQLEGFGTVPYPTVLGEETLAYEALIESSRSGVSYLAHESGQGIPNALGAAVSFAATSFDPDYRYILTRIPQIQTGRRVIYEAGGVAIEQRHEPLDVTIQSGLTALTNPIASSVAGWVNAPLVFVVTGSSRRYEHLDLAFALPSASLKIAPAKNTRFTRSGSSLGACVTITGNARVHVVATSVPANVGVVLTSMRAAYGKCR